MFNKIRLWWKFDGKIRLFLLKNTSEEILEGNLGNDKN